MTRHHTRRAIVAIAVAGTLLAACSSNIPSSTGSSGGTASTSSSATIEIGIVTTSSGASASVGIPDIQGAQLAVANINANGGLLGHKVQLVTRDDGGVVATAVSEARQLITSDHISALLGPDNSAVAAAEASLIKTAGIPFILGGANDIALTTTDLTPTTVQIVQNTIMEPASAAYYVKQHLASDKPIRLALIAPDYNFGLDSIATFEATLKKIGVSFKLVDKALPSPTATTYSQYLPGLIAARPTLIFATLFGGGLVTFSQEAAQQGLLNTASVISYYNIDALKALPSSILSSRVELSHLIGLVRAPFWSLPGGAGITVAREFHKQYKSWPDDYAIQSYAAVQTWADGVNAAHSFTGTKVVSALLGKNISTVLGTYKIRSCDHQELDPEYLGTVSPTVSTTYGIHLLTNIEAVPGTKTEISCAASAKLRSGS